MNTPALAARRILLVVVASICLAGCVGQSALVTAEKLDRRAADLKIVLMPPDIVLSEISVGGLVEPHAEWTSAAKQYAQAALQDFLTKRHAQLVFYKEPTDPERAHLQEQIGKLHTLVGAAILIYQYQPVTQLPSKKGSFAWSMGQEVRTLGEDSGADYALFLHIQDSYSSPGRVAAQIGLALLGVAMPGGAQVGYASLVDLRSGEIVWFNRLARASGDLRKPDAARETVEFLMSKFPT